MALSQATLDAIAAAVAQALASVAAPATPTASGHVGPSGKRDGREHPCTVEPGVCTGRTRHPDAAASHDPAAPRYHSRRVA